MKTPFSKYAILTTQNGGGYFSCRIKDNSSERTLRASHSILFQPLLFAVFSNTVKNCYVSSIIPYIIGNINKNQNTV